MIIDVSKHQGTINWDAVKNSGKVDGAILRCGYGSDIKSQDDAQFKRNADECIRLGIPFGVYLYSYAKSEAAIDSEVAHTLRLSAPYKGKLSFPVYFDSEENGTQSFAKTGAVRYCTAIENAGYKAGIYASKSWFTSYLNGVDKWTKWVAAWTSQKPSIKGMDMWQYTDKGKVPGINGNVDCSYSYFEPSYRAHVQSIGWMPYVSNGACAGTEGKSLRMEAVQFSKSSGITAQAHCQTYGDMNPVAPGEVCGTVGESKRLECIKLDCSRKIKYRVHIQGIGWSDYYTNGQWAGTKGEARRLEAIEVMYS